MLGSEPPFAKGKGTQRMAHRERRRMRSGVGSLAHRPFVTQGEQECLCYLQRGGDAGDYGAEEGDEVVFDAGAGGEDFFGG